jgi:hypothetical protein
MSQLFPVEKEYTRCLTALHRIGILSLLPESQRIGVIGIDKKEYAIPTKEQVVELFDQNAKIVERKVTQGFDRLELIPMAIPLSPLIDKITAALLQRASEGKISQTRRLPSDPFVPVHVNTEKTVWVWDTLRQVLDTDELVYFPQEYSRNHRGQTKGDVIKNGRICAVLGWSVGLVESFPMMPQQGQGKTVGDRRQLEIGFSPHDYLRTFQTQEYDGETGKTLEDFLIKFLIHLDMANEVSHDRYDHNALWLLGHYVKYVQQVKSDLVPTGWWHRTYGRLRLDAHRPGNKRCTRSWGGSSTVRLRQM